MCLSSSIKKEKRPPSPEDDDDDDVIILSDNDSPSPPVNGLSHFKELDTDLLMVRQPPTLHPCHPSDGVSEYLPRVPAEEQPRGEGAHH